MSQAMEDRLRRMLSDTALREVPDSTVIPPRRKGDDLGLVSSRRLRPWLAPAITGIAAALIAVVATVIVVNHSGPSTVAGPTPSQGTTSAASTKLTSTQPVTTQPATTKLETTKAATTRPGTIKPAAQVTVPNLIGKSYDQAAAELAALGLTSSKEMTDGTATLDTVVGSSGAAIGAHTSAGTLITLRVSNNQLFVVPNLSNLTPDAAAAELTSLGWTGTAATMTQLASQTTDQALIGLVAVGRVDVQDQNQKSVSTPSQTPAAGSTARKNSHVTVVVYSKKLVVLPEFTANVTLVQEVQAKLADAGFSNVTFLVKTPAPPPNVPNSFISVAGAAARTPVPYDTPITITVWGEAPPVSTTK